MCSRTFGRVCKRLGQLFVWSTVTINCARGISLKRGRASHCEPLNYRTSPHTRYHGAIKTNSVPIVVSNTDNTPASLYLVSRAYHASPSTNLCNLLNSYHVTLLITWCNSTPLCHQNLSKVTRPTFPCNFTIGKNCCGKSGVGPRD